MFLLAECFIFLLAEKLVILLLKMLVLVTASGNIDDSVSARENRCISAIGNASVS